MSVIDEVAKKFDAEVKVEIKTCPICKSHDTTKMMCNDRYGISARYRICGSCNLVYLSNLPGNEFFTWFYAGRYRKILEEKFQRSFSNEVLKIDQIKYANELFKFIESHLRELYVTLGDDSAVKMLDIGGSTGEVSAQLSKLVKNQGVDLDVTVQDPSGPELEEAIKHGFKTSECLFEEFKPATHGKFDLIILCQTIDHVLDPAAVIENALSLLADGGIFFVDYVDFSYNVKKKGFVESIKIDHAFNFSKKNWNILLSKFNLKILDKAVSSDFHLRGYLLQKSKSNFPETDVDYVLAHTLM